MSTTTAPDDNIEEQLQLPRKPTIAVFWIGVCGILHFALWVRIMTVRVFKPTDSHNLNNLHNNNTDDNLNLRVTRSHGNYAENGPIFAIMFLVVDICGVISNQTLEISGLIFIFGRFLHSIGLNANDGSTIGRTVGAALTLCSLLNMSIQCFITATSFSTGSSTGSNIMSQRLIGLFIALIISLKFGGKMVTGLDDNGDSNGDSNGNSNGAASMCMPKEKKK